MRRLLPFALVGFVLVVGIFGCAGLKEPAAPGRPIEAARAEVQGATRTSAVGEPSDDAMVLQIQPGASTATFTVDEILRGAPNTVVGRTDQVAGQIALDPDEPGNTKVGTILVGARTLATDDNLRNRMIRNFILSTNEFEYIVFAPTTLTGLPASVTHGVAYPIRIDGKLTIKAVTRDVSFDAIITPVSVSELKGSATTTINQKDFGITIPRVPLVAGVADEVKLDLNFVARAA